MRTFLSEKKGKKIGVCGIICMRAPRRNLDFLYGVVASTVLLKKFSVESHITVGFSAFWSSIGVYEHVTSKNKIIP